MSELAKKIGKHTSETSKILKELERARLVEHEQEEGKRVKYYYATDYAKQILTAVTKATQPRPKEKIEEWQINEFLSILEDTDLSEDLRLSYSTLFHHVCSEHPNEVISHESARRLFEKVVTNPFQDRITADLTRSVSAVLLAAMRHEKLRRWGREKLVATLVRNMEDVGVDDKTRIWTIRKLGRIASSGIDPSVRYEAEKKFLEVWFSESTEPESELGKTVKQELVELASKRLFEIVRSRARDQHEKVKAKAEILLKGLKECLVPRTHAQVI